MSDVGRLIAGRYRLVEQVGRGGMGTVWRAEDELLGRQVAVKQLHVSPHLSEEELTTLYERTRREARSAARITHPNVVVVHDVVDDQGLPCIVMEYVPSNTLGDLLKNGGAISPQEAARIGRGMIAALRAAHEAGVLHRDVKPGNVLLGPQGRVVLTDFGIAMATGTSTLTKTGEVVGSIDYIAPERVRGRKPGPASDLWALGATLYQAVEGRAPFRKTTAIETGYAIAVEPLDPPKRAGALTPLIESLLAKEPELRPTAEETERALRVPASEAETRAQAMPSFTETLSLTRQRPEPTPAPAPAPASPPLSGSASTSASPATPETAPGTASVPNPATASTPSPATPTPAPAPKKGSKAQWTAAGAALAVVAVAGGVYVFGLDNGSHKDAVGQQSAAKPSQSATPPYTPPPVPAGYHMVEEKDFGISFPVPDGWTRQADSDTEGTVDHTQEVRYLDPTRMARLTINVLDFAQADQVKHLEGVEADVKKLYPVYQRMRLQETKFRGQPAAVWEFRFKGQARWFRALDLAFGEEGGKEYAIYVSAPAEQWGEYLPAFNNVRDGLRLP
ncbi:serine/threonine-protein kinase [Streptomyces sp. NPDC005336]|uniref:serine/threonine-protein kinase n=1 Tax=Streptomyces sp. NPDC005336 TaxID=3157035 RepID=UPI0033A5231A